MKDIKIKYNEAFGTIHSRDYYKGKSFHYAGEWTPGAHYFSDDFNVDFVVKDNCLLACAQSHFATLDRMPKDWIYDEHGITIGIASRYWDFVLCGLHGKSPKIKIENQKWYVSYDEGLTWEELADTVQSYWDETEDGTTLTVNNVTKTVITEISTITDEDIDSIMSDFNIPHHE